MPVKGVSKNDPDEGIIKTKTKPRCAINMRRLVKRRRKPHEIPSRAYAIYNQCRECHGWEGEDGRSLAEEVLACPDTECRLWLVRCKDASKSPYIDSHEETLPTPLPNSEGSDISTKNPSDPRFKHPQRRRFSRSKMISGFCEECQGLTPGESRDPIRKCCSPPCWLYPWRTGKLDVSTD